MTSQVNPKKDATIKDESTKKINISLDDLSKNALYQKGKASAEKKDDPQTKLTDPKIEHKIHTPIIGG